MLHLPRSPGRARRLEHHPTARKDYCKPQEAKGGEGLVAARGLAVRLGPGRVSQGVSDDINDGLCCFLAVLFLPVGVEAGRRGNKKSNILHEQDTTAETTDLDQSRDQVMTQEVREPTPVWEGLPDNSAELEEAEGQSVVEDEDAAEVPSTAQTQHCLTPLGLALLSGRSAAFLSTLIDHGAFVQLVEGKVQTPALRFPNRYFCATRDQTFKSLSKEICRCLRALKESEVYMYPSYPRDLAERKSGTQTLYPAHSLPRLADVQSVAGGRHSKSRSSPARPLIPGPSGPGRPT
ncbi:hypothetical protein V8F20_000304 [Naviculisporaceae sp. PSN 640]